jgi:2-iminobutanoate/2-iminopropanoate deaminase
MFNLSATLLLVFSILFSPPVYSQELSTKKFFPAEATSKLYSSGVLVDKTYYVAGSGSAIPGGGQPETFPNQVRQCLKNIERYLQFAGLEMEHIVQAWVMVDDPANYRIVDEVFREVFPYDPPARTTLGIGVIPQGNHIEITVIAYTDPSERRIIGSSENKPNSPAVLAGNTLYISGQHASGEIPSKFENEAKLVLDNAGFLLKQAGLNFDNVVFSNVYLDDPENLGKFNKVFSKYFKKGSEPARANVFVNNLPNGSHVEDTFIATTDLASKKIIRPENYDDTPKELTALSSPAVFAGNTLYLSAQYGGFSSGENTIEQQLRGVMSKHQNILREAGLDYSSIVSANVYLRDINDYGPLNKVYPEFFTQGRPGVRTCFQPFSGNENNNSLIRAFFIAARTKTE